MSLRLSFTFNAYKYSTFPPYDNKLFVFPQNFHELFPTPSVLDESTDISFFFCLPLSLSLAPQHNFPSVWNVTNADTFVRFVSRTANGKVFDNFHYQFSAFQCCSEFNFWNFSNLYSETRGEIFSQFQWLNTFENRIFDYSDGIMRI